MTKDTLSLVWAMLEIDLMEKSKAKKLRIKINTENDSRIGFWRRRLYP